MKKQTQTQMTDSGAPPMRKLETETSQNFSLCFETDTHTVVKQKFFRTERPEILIHSNSLKIFK
jgi:hypothetical protein